jgi:hypothetical protein
MHKQMLQRSKKEESPAPSTAFSSVMAWYLVNHRDNFIFTVLGDSVIVLQSRDSKVAEYLRDNQRSTLGMVRDFFLRHD